jgi:KTSC domain
MARLVVESSSLLSVSYLPGRSLLEVEFRDRTLYQFFDVPPDCVEQLLSSNSKGSYFNRNIRNRFRYQRISLRSSSPQQQN